jgi:hypothetical protein
VQGCAWEAERKSQECEPTKELKAKTCAKSTSLGPFGHTCVMNHSWACDTETLKLPPGLLLMLTEFPFLAGRLDAVIPRTCAVSGNLSSRREDI